MPYSIYDIKLKPPYLAVTRSLDMYNVITPLNSDYYTQGYIWAVNYDTVDYKSGDRILYESMDRPPIQVGGVVFDLVDESKIFLIEPPEEPK